MITSCVIAVFPSSKNLVVLVDVYSGMWRLHFIGYLSSLNFSALTITIISAEAVLLFVT